MDTVLQVSHVWFRYDAVDVLRDVTFAIGAGDYVGLVGPNGSGKTTLIKVILGLLKPYQGTITVFDQPVERFSSWQRIGYMPQSLALFNPIFPATVAEVVSLGLLSEKPFPKRITGTDKKTVMEALDRLQVANLQDRLIGHLSGGQQQRVFLARALITRPNLLILDEPGNSLDAASRELFFTILNELNHRQHTAIILITHDTGNVGKYTDKLLYLDQTAVFYRKAVDFYQAAGVPAT